MDNKSKIRTVMIVIVCIACIAAMGIRAYKMMDSQEAQIDMDFEIPKM